MDISVSVVIPTFKRNRLLKRCIDALLVQTLEESAYEIIVADDAASQETRSLVEDLSLRFPLPAIRYCAVQGNHGPAAARNTGWKAARGSIVAFTDDDCIPEADWLAKGSSAFQDDVAGVSGRIFVPVSHKPTDYERNTSFLEFSEFATANCFYRKEVLAEAGGFDERFTAAWREDADLYFSLLKNNKRLVAMPDAIVVHPVRTGHWGVSIREQSKSRFNALLYKKHPDLYREKIYNPVLSHYYTIVASCFFFLLAGILGIRQLGLVALAVWITATISLSRKRLRGTSHSLKHVLEMITTSLVIPFLSLYWRAAGAVKFNVFFY